MKIISFIDKYWLGFLVMAGLLVFGAISLLSSGQPVWFDEGYSILLAKHSFGELLSLTAVDAHPPLYYLLLKAWGSLFGFSEFALRSLSALLMASGIVVLLAMIRRFFSTKVALIVFPFLLFAPFLLRYGYEIRMYALATLIAVTATYVLIRAQSSKDWKWWVVYAILVALGMYTLYLMVAVWFAHLVWLLVVSIRSKKRPFWSWPWLYAFAGAVVLFLPYILTFIYQLVNSALPGMGNEITATQLVNITSILAMYTPEWALGGWASIALIFAVVVTSVLGVSVYRTLTVPKRRVFMLFVAVSVVPIVFYALTSLPPRDPVFIVRYMAHSAIFIYALAGLVVALALTRKGLSRKRSMRAAGAGIVVLAVLVGGVFTLQSSGNFNFERMQKPLTHDVRAAVSCNDKTLVVADDPYTYIDSVFYFDGCDLHFYSSENVAYKGGYAMLHDSSVRIASPADATSESVVHLRWDGAAPSFIPDDRYRLVETQTFDKQVVETYRLIEE